MPDFNNPLDENTLKDLHKAMLEVYGDDLTRPRQFVIGRLVGNGTLRTNVKDGEYGHIWVREPGADTGDAVQAINTVLKPDDISFDHPVMVKRSGTDLLITGKAPESANYTAQFPTSSQKPVFRAQYLVALIRPTQPASSFYAFYTGGIFQLNNVPYLVTDVASSDFSGDVPVADALSIKVEVDPTTDPPTYYETTGSAFTTTSLFNAFKDGDLDKTRTTGRYLLGWIRLYAGQTAIEVEDILPGEHMLDIMEDHDQTINRDLGDQHANYVYKFPTTGSRNKIVPTTAMAFALAITDPTDSWGVWELSTRGFSDTNFTYANYTGSGNQTNSVAVGAQVDNSSADDLTNTYAFRAYRGFNNEAGSITNAYGLYIDDVDSGGTANHAIFTNDGLVHFGDATDIQPATDVVPLTVQGFGGATADAGQFGDIDSGDYSAIEADGTYRMEGDATTWDDMRIPGLAVAVGASAPDLGAWLAAGNLQVRRFDGNAITEQVFFTCQLPHGYKEGTDIFPHVHWGPVNGNAGNVRWNLEYSWANFETVFPNGTIIGVVDAANGTAWMNQVANFSAIDGTGQTLSSMLVCRLFRDPTDGDDTYGSDAGFLEFDFHFQLDTIASRQPFAK